MAFVLSGAISLCLFVHALPSRVTENTLYFVTRSSYSRVAAITAV